MVTNGCVKHDFFKEKEVSFKIQPYDRLTACFSSTVDKLLGHHRADTIDTLPEPRRSQARFLNTMIEQLNETEMEEGEKARVLSAAMIVVRQEIENSYRVRSPETSLFFQCLTNNLCIDRDNALEPEDRCYLINEMMRFMENIIYIEGHSENGLVPTSPYLILGERLNALWTLSATLIRDAKVEIMTRNLKDLAVKDVLVPAEEKQELAQQAEAKEHSQSVSSAAVGSGAASSLSAKPSGKEDGVSTVVGSVCAERKGLRRFAEEYSKSGALGLFAKSQAMSLQPKPERPEVESPKSQH